MSNSTADADVVVLHIAPERASGRLTLRVTGEMDVATADDLVEVVRSLSADDLRHLRLDLAGLSFIDASGLTALLLAAALVAGQGGGRLALAGARPLTRRLLRITNLLDTFEVEPMGPEPLRSRR